MSAKEGKITIGQYLLTRLEQLNVKVRLLLSIVILIEI
jgi:TPP-dependent 2-oxoacid decarboxylase